MRFVNVRELKSKTSEILKAATGEDIIVTSRGKPIAVVRGFDGSEFGKTVPWRGRPSRVDETLASWGEKERTPVWSPLKAVFWDYPELADEANLKRHIDEARGATQKDTYDWILSRMLERGRVVDVRQFFDLNEIRSALPSLRLTPLARKKWERMIEVYGRP
jgi:prevent-host-death family protein